MLRDTAVARIQDGIGFRRDMVDQIILRLQEEQRDLERGKTLPSFLLLEDQALALLAGNNSVALPSDYLRRSNELIRYYPPGGDGAFRKIPWRDYAVASEAYVDYSPSGPAVATLRVSTIDFFPLADTNYELSWDYYQKADLLVSNIENKWLQYAPELLIGGAGLRLSRDLRNKEGERLFAEMYKQSRTTWFAETIVEEEAEVVVLGGNA